MDVNIAVTRTVATPYTALNSTFYKNSAENGGAISLNITATGKGSYQPVLRSLTIYQNQASNQGGGLYTSATATNLFPILDNNIVAGNAVENPPGDGADVFGQVKSSGYNLIGQGGVADGNIKWGSLDFTGTDSNPLSPGLDSGLTSNGGPTQTIILLNGSTAYRNGDPTLGGSTDQRGYTRGTRVSIGAYDPDATH
jgi:hypothetical protein